MVTCEEELKNTFKTMS